MCNYKNDQHYYWIILLFQKSHVFSDFLWCWKGMNWFSHTSGLHILCMWPDGFVLIFLCPEKDMAWNECCTVRLSMLMLLTKLFFLGSPGNSCRVADKTGMSASPSFSFALKTMFLIFCRAWWRQNYLVGKKFLNDINNKLWTQLSHFSSSRYRHWERIISMQS